MKRIMIIAILFFVFFVLVCCETNDKTGMMAELIELDVQLLDLKIELEKLQSEIEKAKIGRYEIYQNTIIRRDQYLLDTSTGRVWAMRIDPDTKDQWWSELFVGGLHLPE